MANTGIKNVITLKQVFLPCPPCIPTGQTKPNVIGDPDYIAPYQDLTACPISYNLDCPIYVAATGDIGGTAQAEVTVFNSVLNNPSVNKVRISVMNGVTEVAFTSFNLPNPTGNYFYASWTGLTTGSRTIRVQYLNSADVVQASCSDLVTINVT